jgi:hypothetical protein
MASRISFNIHGQNIPDKGRLFAHLDALQPRALVVLDDVGIARELKGRYPNTIVIYRFNGDGGDGDLHRKYQAAEWLEKMIGKVGDNAIHYHTTNEPTLDKQLIDWHVELVKAANDRGVALCVLNLAVGNPEPEQWVSAKPLLELLAVHRQHILGSHEYAGGVITSGLIGGNPTLIKPDTWPQNVSGITQFHMGRFNFLLQYCPSMDSTTPATSEAGWRPSRKARPTPTFAAGRRCAISGKHGGCPGRTSALTSSS